MLDLVGSPNCWISHAVAIYYFQTIVTTMSDQNVPVVYRLIDDAKDDLDNMLDESQR